MHFKGYLHLAERLLFQNILSSFKTCLIFALYHEFNTLLYCLTGRKLRTIGPNSLSLHAISTFKISTRGAIRNSLRLQIKYLYVIMVFHLFLHSLLHLQVMLSCISPMIHHLSPIWSTINNIKLYLIDYILYSHSIQSWLAILALLFPELRNLIFR